MKRCWRERLRRDDSLLWVEVCGFGMPSPPGGLGRCFCGATATSTSGRCPRHEAATFLFMPEVYWYLRCPGGDAKQEDV